jgi:mRNA-degrading endonuclease RelE of RelBE toxin-antitoxin system
VDVVIRDLQASEDPARLGKLKKGRLKNMYAAYMGKYRVIYDICRKEITLLFVDVGKHKEVYGTD